VAEQAANATADQKALNETTLAQLRNELDTILDYQANDAPSWVSLEGAEYPEREGSLKDVLAARQMFAEAEMLDEDEEVDEEGEDDVDETSDDKMVGLQTDPAAVEEMGDSSSAPESTVAAVKKEEHGDEQVIAEKLHNLTLDQEIQEASPASKAKLKMESTQKVKSPQKPLSSPVKSPKKSVASPLKKQQSKASLHKSQLPVRATTPKPPWKT
jgi:hypothetical protein